MNPVLSKEILGLLRLRRAVTTHLCFVGVLAVLVLATWPQQGVVSLASRGQDALLLGLILGQLVLLVLFVPGVASVSITAEREQGTLEMLYASRLSAWQLIIGKLLSAVGYPLLLLASGLPFLGLLNYRGDVDFATLMWAYLVLLVSAVLLAVLSLTISALCRQSSTALIAAYVAVLAACGGVLVPAAIMLSSSGGSTAAALHYVRSISPVAAALSLLRPQLAEFGGRAGGVDAITGQAIGGFRPAWQVFLPFACAVSVACVLVLITVLRRPPTGAEGFARSDDRAAAGGGGGRRNRLVRRILFLIDPEKPRKPMGDFNPLMAKEARTNQLRSGSWMIRTFYVALFVSIGLALMALNGGQTQHGDLLRYVAAVLVAFQVGLIALVNPSLTSPAVSAEVEGGTFEMLRLTPLRAGQLFWGKLLPALPPALLPIAAMLPAYGAVWFVDPIYLRPITLLVPVFVLTAVLCCTTGLACSAFTASTARATVGNYLIIAALIVLPLLGWFAAGTLLDPRLVAWLALPSPLIMSLNLLPDGAPEVARLWPQHLMLLGGLSLLALVAARARVGRLLRKG